MWKTPSASQRKCGNTEKLLNQLQAQLVEAQVRAEELFLAEEEMSESA